MLALLLLVGLVVAVAVWAIGNCNGLITKRNFAPATPLEITEPARREAPKVAF